jgi:hypothetical protein
MNCNFCEEALLEQTIVCFLETNRFPSSHNIKKNQSVRKTITSEHINETKNNKPDP